MGLTSHGLEGHAWTSVAMRLRPVSPVVDPICPVVRSFKVVTVNLKSPHFTPQSGTKPSFSLPLFPLKPALTQYPYLSTHSLSPNLT